LKLVANYKTIVYNGTNHKMINEDKKEIAEKILERIGGK
jgi:hypothetical protein